MIFLFLFLTSSLSAVGSRFVCLVGTDSGVFLFMADYCCFGYICSSFFMHSSVSGHLGCFHVLAVVNRAAVNTGIHVSFSVFVS